MSGCTSRSPRAVVAVVGGGASGSLSALHLVRTAREAGRELHVVVFEPGTLTHGLAYCTDDPRHRLNVPAKGMSALPDDPGHFLAWLRRHVDADAAPGDFAPRLHYARYLADTLAAEVAASPGIRFEHVPSRVTDLRRVGRRLRLTLDNGTSRPADAAVLALGHGAPATRWAPAALRRSARFVADPWRTDADASPAVAPREAVLLVGAGLTMADMARRWYRDGVTVHVTSRHGLLPLPHAEQPATPTPAPELPEGPITLAAARRMVFARIREHGDWRRAVDGMRPVTAALWEHLDERERARFVATAARRWDRVRHRVDPEVHHWLNARRDDGSLVVHDGTVTRASESRRGLTVGLSDGAELTVAAVVNCTGASRRCDDDDPLVLNLVTNGFATPGPLGLGFATAADGRLVGSATDNPAAVWTIGPLRRGELWESTAVPEIREQAAEAAAAVIAALPSTRLRRRARDPYGLPLTARPDAAEAYTAGLGRILRVQSGAETLLREAVEIDPDFAVGHAALALLGTEWSVDVDVPAALDAAHRAAPKADEREQRFVEVATARVREPGPASAAALLAYIHSYPEDALAVSVAVPTIAFGGATEIPAEAWALVEGIAPAYGDDWWYRGLLAFVRQEQEDWDGAARLARLALDAEPAAGHAVHARAHVHYETGDHEAGLRWLDGWIHSCGARAAHRAHFSWHAALHELALGRDRAALARYAEQLAPTSVTGVRALVDSASLLWRGYVCGAWGSVDVAPVLATVEPGLLADPPTPFVGLHAAVALAAAGDCGGLARLRRRCAAHTDPVFAHTVAPLADALADLVHGDPDRALDLLQTLPGVDRLGGSAAQREIVQETLIWCAVRSGRVDLARTVLTDRLERRSSPRDARRSAQLVG